MRVPDLTRQDSLAAMARHVLDQAPPRFALAGLSMGGYLAFELWRQAPQRIERLAFVNTSARPDSPEQSARRREILSQVQIGEFRGMTASLMKEMISEGRLDDTLLVAAITAMAEDVGRDGFIRQTTAIMSRPDSRPDLATIDCPVVVIGGANDRLTPPEIHAEIAGRIPGSRLFIIRSAGTSRRWNSPRPWPGCCATGWRNRAEARRHRSATVFAAKGRTLSGGVR